MYSSLSDHYSAFSLLGAEGGANAQRAQLEETIRKSLETGTVTAGVQTPTTFGSAGQLSPLVNEDLDKLVSQIDFKAQHLAFFAWLPKADATQTIVQYVRWLSHGSAHIDNATMEGELAVQNVSSLARGSVQIKQYIETRGITDIGNAQMNTVGGSVVPTEPLVMQTQEGMLTLHRSLERDSLYGDAAVAEAKIDGVVTQLKTAGQYENLDGEQLTMELLEERVRDLQAAPNFGMPTHIFVVPKVYTALTKQQIAMARREMNGEGITYGFPNGALKILVGESILSVVPLIFLDDRAILPVSSAMNNGTALAVVAINQQPAVTGAPVSGSLFGPADLGSYEYAVMAFGPNGFTKWTQLTTQSMTVEGDSLTMKFTNDAAYTYYKVFRTPVNTVLTGVEATDIKKYQLIATIKNAGGGTTTFVDLNAERTGCYKTLILRQDPAEICLYQLIKLMRIPLARVKAVQPFYLITAVGLALKVPEHNWLMTNCAAPASV